MQTEVEQLIQDIDKLKEMDELRKVDDLNKLIHRINKIVKEFKSLSKEGKNAVTNKDKLQRILNDLQDADKMGPVKNRLVQTQITEQKKLDDEAAQREAFKVKKAAMERKQATQEEEMLYDEDEDSFEESPQIINLSDEIDKKTRSADIPPRNTPVYKNPQIDAARLTLKKQRRVLTEDEKIEQAIRFKKNSNIIKHEVAGLVSKYREAVQNRPEQQQEATQSSLVYIPCEDVENIVLPGEDSTVLYGLEEEHSKKKIKPIDKIKKEQNKKDRIFKHRKRQIEKAASHQYDGYYDSIEAHDDEKIEKEKMPLKTILLGIGISIFVVGCVIATVLAIVQLG